MQAVQRRPWVKTLLPPRDGLPSGPPGGSDYVGDMPVPRHYVCGYAQFVALTVRNHGDAGRRVATELDFWARDASVFGPIAAMLLAGSVTALRGSPKNGNLVLIVIDKRYAAVRQAAAPLLTELGNAFKDGRTLPDFNRSDEQLKAAYYLHLGMLHQARFHQSILQVVPASEADRITSIVNLFSHGNGVGEMSKPVRALFDLADIGHDPFLFDRRTSRD